MREDKNNFIWNLLITLSLMKRNIFIICPKFFIIGSIKISKLKTARFLAHFTAELKGV